MWFGGEFYPNHYLAISFSPPFLPFANTPIFCPARAFGRALSRTLVYPKRRPDWVESLFLWRWVLQVVSLWCYTYWKRHSNAKINVELLNGLLVNLRISFSQQGENDEVPLSMSIKECLAIFPRGRFLQLVSCLFVPLLSYLTYESCVGTLKANGKLCLTKEIHS